MENDSFIEDDDRDSISTYAGSDTNLGMLWETPETLNICQECNQEYTNFNWCRHCNAKRFKENFKNWTSGNEKIDKLIQESQLNASTAQVLEWVPYERFQDITYLNQGGFSVVYKATWIDGYIIRYEHIARDWYRYGRQTVVLKNLNNSKEISSSFLREV
jgi:hypothetical protein